VSKHDDLTEKLLIEAIKWREINEIKGQCSEIFDFSVNQFPPIP
jgi:hypothetical protein